MKITAHPALIAPALLASACFQDVAPGETLGGDTTGEAGDGDGDGDGDPTGDGDGELGDGDGDGDGDGAPGCQPGDCGDDEYCIAGVCEAAPEGMAAIEAGPFWMGCNEEIDVDCEAAEYPYHEVTLSAYAMDRTEVSADEYAECVNQGQCAEPITDLGNNSTCTPNMGMLPIGCVSWFQARDYCEWKGKQLPTEAQWEKAARGTDGRIYPWGNEPPTCNLAAMAGCGMLGPVGSLPAGASPYGVLDMAGSSMEWTADWYSASYYVVSPDIDPPGPANGTRRSIRSGSIFFLPAGMRNSARQYDIPNLPTPDTASAIVGFRCAYVP